MDPRSLADEIIQGRILTREDDLASLAEADLTSLLEGADRIRAAFRGDHVDLCSIISGKSGRCGENCRFCAQSAHHHTDCEIYDLLDEDTIAARGLSDEQEGVHRFSIVNSGYGPGPEDFEKIVRIYERLRHDLSISLCASLGFLTDDQLRRLRLAGVTSIHSNLETSRRFFPMICTTHSFDDKIANIRRAQNQGLRVCSGGIIGLGETWQDRIDMALTLQELGILSIPLNSLMPITGTPLAENPRLTEEEILRTVAIFRYINPRADIRLAGGRALMEDRGRRAFASGASAAITGNMLTTSGSTIRQDRAMLNSLGRTTGPLA